MVGSGLGLWPGSGLTLWLGLALPSSIHPSLGIVHGFISIENSIRASSEEFKSHRHQMSRTTLSFYDFKTQEKRTSSRLLATWTLGLIDVRPYMT